MKKYYLYAITIAILFILESCNIMYRPNMQNVPLFKEKNELRSSLSLTNFQIAYSVTKNIGLMANAQFGGKSWTVDDVFNIDTKSKYSSNRKFVEGGVGYFMSSDNKVFEFYGGGGVGQINFLEERINSNTNALIDKWDFSANTLRLFVQPNMGYTNDVVDIAFSSRVSALKFSNIKNTFQVEETLEYDINKIDQPLYVFIEPAITLRVGWKFLKFHIQIMRSYKINYEELNYLPLSFNAGLHFNIAPRYKKVKKN